MRFALALLAALFIVAPTVQGQHSHTVRCHTMEADAQLRANNPSIGALEDMERWLQPAAAQIKAQMDAGNFRMPAVITIPTVVHVIHDGDAVGQNENISDAQILSQIEVLNQDFRRMAGTRGFNSNPVGADVEIEFCLAKIDPNGNPTDGINRVDLGTASWTSNSFDATAKPATSWDPNQYLNMWTAELSGGILGYAQFPSNSGLSGLNTNGGAANTDGVVMTANAFGSDDFDTNNNFYMNATYNLGRTCTHEVGHWLGLRHIWGDGNCTVDDFCNDTPNSDDANYNCVTHTSCSSTDMIENYMDYTNDACMNIFTQDQKARMIAVMNVATRRASLLNSTVCNSDPQLAFSTATRSEVEGTSCNSRIVSIPVEINSGASMSGAATATFTVGGATDATAGLWSDYEILTPTLTFAQGATASQDFQVRIYEDAVVEPNETIEVTMTVSGGGTTADASANTLTITVTNDDNAPTAGAGSTTLINENWNAYGGGWFINNGANAWELGTAPTQFSSNCAFIGQSGAHTYSFTTTSNSRLFSPVFNTTGLTGITLSFDHYIEGENTNGTNYDYGKLQYSLDGGTSWTDLNTTQFQGISNVVNYTTTLPAACENQASVQIGWQWINDNSIGTNPPWAIDNILIEAPSTGNGIQSLVNTGSGMDAYLGPNQTVHFYDPATGDIMVTIENLTGHDYGCTTVEVDRTGPSAQTFEDAAVINNTADKSYLVTAFNNNPTGAYNITLYYTAAEVAGWEGSSTNARSAAHIVKTNSNISAVTVGNGTSQTIEYQAATNGTFGSDVTFTAGFATGFSGFSISAPPPPLPVELLSFVGNRESNGVMLKWETAAEVNNDHFILERSADGINFIDITSVDGAGTTSEAQSYQHLDATAPNTVLYYRLRQVDFDGSFDYSNVVRIDFSSNSAVSVYPNPASSVMTININGGMTGDASLELYNMNGQLVARKSIILDGNATALEFPVDTYAAGVYTLRSTIAGESTFTKVIIE